ncbi:MAG TPA: hypothetical protein VFO36_10110 [Nitrospiraceae bacterium]|nr:hypothetical protein [Nitrospiraceae bacterium]
MLTHDEFGELRLADFAPRERIRALADWEFLGRMWVGEAIGFSEWLRPHDRQNVLESLALDMEDLSEQVVDQVLSRLRLPLRRGMTRSELVRLLGRPVETHVFADDRKTFEFRHGEPDRYLVSCTVLNDGGLTYVAVTACVA